jgi:2-oxoacid:acceptor oxidoreductase delta subunit (pyruvate/2-ketoisovalerate family)
MALLSSEENLTASWRTLRPEIGLERCTKCNFCWKYCPDVAIVLGPDGYPRVLEEHCKGCGICAEVCPPKTIAMVAEA